MTEATMTDAAEAAVLRLLYKRFTPAQQRAVFAQFEALRKAYPHKCHHHGGYTELWLTAIADVRDDGAMAVGGGPWL
jgi:hypothetical protein